MLAVCTRCLNNIYFLKRVLSSAAVGRPAERDDGGRSSGLRVKMRQAAVLMRRLVMLTLPGRELRGTKTRMSFSRLWRSWTCWRNESTVGAVFPLRSKWVRTEWSVLCACSMPLFHIPLSLSFEEAECDAVMLTVRGTSSVLHVTMCEGVVEIRRVLIRLQHAHGLFFKFGILDSLSFHPCLVFRRVN